MNVEGTIKEIFETAQVSDKFSKRDFVVTIAGTYPQDILIQLTQDKCNLLDSFKVGDSVNVSINLKGRQWTSPQGEVKYFNTLEGWRIESEKPEWEKGLFICTPHNKPEPAAPAYNVPPIADVVPTDDDLPF